MLPLRFVTIPEAFQIAIQRHQAGHLAEAEALYRQILAVRPQDAEALHLLGVVAHQVGRHESAVELFRQALTHEPNSPACYSNLGEAYRSLGHLNEAIAGCRKAIQLQPDLAEAHNNLGSALSDKGEYEKAIAAFRRAIELKPSYAVAHRNLGNALKNAGHVEEAIPANQRAVQLDSNYAEGQSSLGDGLQEKGQSNEAILAYRKAIQLKPDYAIAWNNLAHALKNQGRWDESIAAYRRALELEPASAAIRSNLLLALHYVPGIDAPTLHAEHRYWNETHARPLVGSIKLHDNDRSASRRLRVGYVSPDFCEHVAGRYLIPLLENHDRLQFEILCYSGTLRTDTLTERFRAVASQWRSTLGVRDEPLAEMIREDGVDILVDLSQHMAGNRLSVFARKPAPVQVSFLGYPAGTGLEAIDCRIIDQYLEVDSATSAYGAPERVSLIDSFWCYDPQDVEIEVNSLPAAENKVVTFGCLANFCKLNEAVLALWARVLRREEGSRVVIMGGADSRREWALELLGQHGVEAHRVEFVESRPLQEYLELYHRLDVVLETFPYNGHTTSLDAFWMGVPVIGLVGKLPVSRAGLSNLMNLGLPELVAHSEDEYVKIASELAADLPRLAHLRATLRSRMENSVLMDAPRFARQIEQVYRQRWQSWCATARAGIPAGGTGR